MKFIGIMPELYEYSDIFTYGEGYEIFTVDFKFILNIELSKQDDIH